MMMMNLERCNQSGGGGGGGRVLDYLLNTTQSTLPEANMTTATYESFLGGDNDSEDDLLSRIERFDDGTTLPMYLQIICLVLLVVTFTVGTIGNIMVTLVISCSRDMRTSTNIFLVNLSIADLLVLVICTPTALIEVTYHPDRWVLGFYMCKFYSLYDRSATFIVIFPQLY